jgi:hypothetical protein
LTDRATLMHFDAPLELCGAADVRIDDPRMDA